MLTELAEVADRTDVENPWHGEGPVKAALEQLERLPVEAPDIERFQLLIGLAEHELRIGRTRSAIDHFELALGLLPRLAGILSEAQFRRTLFRSGVAWMRYGENQNCLPGNGHAGHSPAACILPIAKAAQHRDQDGSRRAIIQFERVLDGLSPLAPLHIKTVWLLNIAYMTVGGYPDEVPVELRIPEEFFDTSGDTPRFTNVAPYLGLDTLSMSGGAVMDDFDGDSVLDLLATTFDAHSSPRFFHGVGDGTFEDRTTEANLEGLYGGLNLVHGDYDNDGDADVYIQRGAWLYTGGRHPNSLLRNDGGRFTDVTFDVGLGEPSFPSQTASWADYDNDGDLDLFVGNEHGDGQGDRTGGPIAFDAPSQLFRNDLEPDGSVRFVEVAIESGISVRAFVKAVIWGDYDGDRWPDLYVSVLGGKNHLFHNRGDGTFEDVARELGVDLPLNSFPVWFWDFDNDGRLDLYVASYRGGQGGLEMVAASAFGFDVPTDMPRLYRGTDAGFEDVTKRVGLKRLHLTMGSNFGDFDNDGWLDFYLGTGYPDYEALMPNVLYRNRGGVFEDVTFASGFGHLQKGHAVVFADYDADGDQDVFAQMGGAFPGDRFGDVLFDNPGNDNHWLAVKLTGVESNRSAIGARIRARFNDGTTREIVRWVNSGGSFGCNPFTSTLGLGRATSVRSLEVYWPTSDTTQQWTDLEVDRTVEITEGRAELAFRGGE